MQKDTNVRQGTTVKKNYGSTIDNNAVVFTIYASDKTTPVYTDEDGCFSVGEAIIEISDPTEKQFLEVEFMFGNTEVSGTVDITVHEKLDGGCLKEITRATGGDCGGTSIDAKFIQLLMKVFGAPLIHAMKREQPEAFLDLIREFEAVKRTFTPSKNGKINIAIPYSTLDTLCKQHLKKHLPSTLLSSTYDNCITLKGDKMRIDAFLFKTLFDKTIKNILSLIQEILTRKESESVTLLLLVVGFAECSLAQSEIRKAFLPRRVIVPEESGLAVLKGAVLFGHNSKAIYSLHDQQHYIELHDEAQCKNAFDIIMQKDTNVRQGTTVKKNYGSTIDNNAVVFTIYASDKTTPVYTDGDGCFSVGEAIIEISDPTEKQFLEVEFMFGNTEVSVHAVEKISGNSCQLSFDLI
ncbi:unnamed protein product [Mytilus coruscus]|uniref:Uncharacterized protein n=1 Tax=Mytilus coruscus TaxID=42192 RepID=A0A6J8DKT7_MYTCO|nr:unnamed protein product [Mytilus coruscus]